MKNSFIKIAFKAFAVASLALLSCKKAGKAPADDPVVNSGLQLGLPQDISNLSGFLVTYTTHQKSGQNVSVYSQLSADFCDPAKNILTGYNHYYNNFENQAYMGNVSVGDVSMFLGLYRQNGSNPTFRYYRGIDSSLPDSVQWRVSGEALIPPTVFASFKTPSYSIDSLPAIIYKSKGLTLRMDPSINRFDSACVIIESSWPYKTLRKAISRRADLILSSDELKEFTLGGSSNNYTINVYHFNYAHIIVNNRVLLFENVRRYYRALTIYS